MLLVSGAALTAVSQPRAKEGVVARLENPTVLRAPAGTRVALVWTLRAGKEPFGASGIYVRVRDRIGKATISEATELGPGRFRAWLSIPRGGVRAIAIALRGWVSDARGTRRADLVFPIANEPAPAMRTVVIRKPARLGHVKCRPPSPLGIFTRGLPEARGTTTRGSVWALFFPSRGMRWQPGSAIFAGSVGKAFKIVFRVTGSGPIRLSVRGPKGAALRPDWGPQRHDGSTWQRPGDEWGVGFTFPTAGCWRLHAERSGASGDVWALIGR